MKSDVSRQEPWWQNYQAASEACNQGHYEKASRILRQALSETDTNIDPLLLNSANQLAERYSKEGKYASAAPLYRTVVAALTRQLGCDHPEVQATSRKLAVALWQSGGLSPTLFAANQ